MMEKFATVSSARRIGEKSYPASQLRKGDCVHAESMLLITIEAFPTVSAIDAK